MPENIAWTRLDDRDLRAVLENHHLPGVRSMAAELLERRKSTADEWRGCAG
jgi:hypothetical protein